MEFDPPEIHARLALLRRGVAAEMSRELGLMKSNRNVAASLAALRQSIEATESEIDKELNKLSFQLKQGPDGQPLAAVNTQIEDLRAGIAHLADDVMVSQTAATDVEAVAADIRRFRADVAELAKKRKDAV
jgi:small ligand-binding sensory domain FIST